LGRSLADFETEHILEWQLLVFFLAKLEAAGFCSELRTYWNTAFELPDNLRQNYPIGIRNKKKHALNWVAAMFPSNNAYIEEFTMLWSHANGRKADVWAGNQPVDPKKVAKYIKQGGKSRINTLKNIRNTILAMKYIVRSDMETAMIAQADRIASMFETLESTILPAQARAKAGTKAYTSRGYSKKWKAFLVERGDITKTKMNAWFDDIRNVINEILEKDGLLRQDNLGQRTPDEIAFRDQMNLVKQGLASMQSNEFQFHNPFEGYLLGQLELPWPVK
jgi:hypothetical protein